MSTFVKGLEIIKKRFEKNRAPKNVRSEIKSSIDTLDTAEERVRKLEDLKKLSGELENTKATSQDIEECLMFG